jgi:alginate O-acetyltransferase complex protein AlgJ
MKANKLFIVVVFLSVLFLVMGVQLLGVDMGFENTENRRLAQLPKLTFVNVNEAEGFKNGSKALFRDLWEYKKDVDAYFNDNLVFKIPLFKAFHLIERDLLGARPIPDKYVEGADGWFFLGDSYSNAILESKGLVRYNESELRKIGTNLQRLRQRFEAEDISLVVAMAPNKHSIYGQYLPIMKRDGITKYDQVRKLIEDSGISFVYLGDGFELMTDRRLYYKTDSHWNTTGGFFAYRKLGQTLKKKLPDMRFLEQEDLSADTILFDNGDIAKMAAIYRPETDVRWVVKDTFAIEVPTIFDNSTDNLTVAGVNSRRCKTDVNNCKVVFYRDSYCTALVPYLSESFGESWFFWTYDINWDVLRKIKPDLVVVQFVERHSWMLFDL